MQATPGDPDGQPPPAVAAAVSKCTCGLRDLHEGGVFLSPPFFSFTCLGFALGDVFAMLTDGNTWLEPTPCRVSVWIATIVQFILSTFSAGLFVYYTSFRNWDASRRRRLVLAWGIALVVFAWNSIGRYSTSQTSCSSEVFDFWRGYTLLRGWVCAVGCMTFAVFGRYIDLAPTSDLT